MSVYVHSFVLVYLLLICLGNPRVYIFLHVLLFGVKVSASFSPFRVFVFQFKVFALRFGLVSYKYDDISTVLSKHVFFFFWAFLLCILIIIEISHFVLMVFLWHYLCKTRGMLFCLVSFVSKINNLLFL